ncbi:MAG: dethiobiotin synthase [Myxococcota bacterium]|jgi:dethiobiotin synthase|nr:dethiobiotin synthase [Myxococcota bacterium]
MNIVCVTGTDTDVGKTWVTAALGAALVARGKSVVAIKPVESGLGGGDLGDGAVLAAATGQEAPTQALTRLCAPLAPPVASEREEVRLDTAMWISEIRRYSRGADVTLVEGAGGLLSPLTWSSTFRDLALVLKARTLVVGLDRLGTLNHTLMTLELLNRSGVVPIGVVLNTVNSDSSTGSNAASLQRVQPFLGVATVPRVRSWQRAVPAMEPVVDWVLR